MAHWLIVQPGAASKKANKHPPARRVFVQASAIVAPLDKHGNRAAIADKTRTIANRSDQGKSGFSQAARDRPDWKGACRPAISAVNSQKIR
jgi:hypothetical protein